MGAEKEKSAERVIIPSTDKERGLVAHAQLTPKSNTGVINVPVDFRPVVPVVFVPGVMGSNLRRISNRKIVWMPDNTIDMLIKYNTTKWFGPSPAERQQYLDQFNTEVCETGPVLASVTSEGGVYLGEGIDAGQYESADALRARGWGAVYGETYHFFLYAFQKRLNAVMHGGTLDVGWQNLCRMPFDKYGMKQTDPLLEEELRTVAKFRYEVWAFGYNWLKSNEDAADNLRKFISQTVLPRYTNNSDPNVRLGTDNKVLVVTHSMGGLVVRSLVAQGGSDNILGVIHGAMPANGTAETYTNIRQGISGTVGYVAGDDAEKVGAVLLQCLGGLELLPFGNRYNSKPEDARVAAPRDVPPVPLSWLLLHDRRRESPWWDMSADVYALYASDRWYGLLPEHNIRHFDPAGIVREKIQDTPSRVIFTQYLRNVKVFHERVAGRYHASSYAIWSASRDFPAVGEVLWEWSRRQSLPKRIDYDFGNEPEIYDTGKGRYVSGNDCYDLSTISHSGDGTVARGALEKDRYCPGLLNYCLLGAHRQDLEGFAHQEAFKDRRVENASLYFTAKIIHSKAGELKP